MYNDAKVRNFFILGKESEFFTELIERFQKVDTNIFEYSFIYGDGKDLFEYLNVKSFSAILIDFTQLQEEEELKDILLTLKIMTKSKQRSIPLVGIYESKDFIEENIDYSLRYLNYFHIVGDSLELLFGNLYYLSFEDESYSMSLAHAKSFEVPYKCNAFANVSRFNGEKFTVESDVPFDDEIYLRVNTLNENAPIPFVNLEQLEKSEITNNLYSFECAIEFDESWGEGDNDSIMQDTTETWFENLDEGLTLKNSGKISLFVYENRLDEYYSILDSSLVNAIQFEVFEEFKDGYLESEVPYDLILFNIFDDPSLDKFDALMCYLADSGSNTIVFLKNHPSRVEALRKMYGYSNLIECGESFNKESFKKMIEILLAKKDKKDEKYYITSQVNPVFALYPFDVLITSLTENEITFKTKVEVPFYSIVRFDAPIPFFVLIVPEYMKLSGYMDGFHYMGIIMGVIEEDRQILRILVRRFINKSPEKWLTEAEVFAENEPIQEELVDESPKFIEKTDDSGTDNNETIGEKGSTRNLRVKSKNKKSKL